MVNASRQFFDSAFGLPPLVIGLVLMAIAAIGLTIQNWNKQAFKKKAWWWVLGIGACFFALPIVIGFLLSVVDQLERVNQSLSKSAAVSRSSALDQLKRTDQEWTKLAEADRRLNDDRVVLPRMEVGGKGTEDDPYRIPIGRFLSIHFTGQENDYTHFRTETARYRVGYVQQPFSHFFWPKGMKPMEVKKDQKLDGVYSSEFGLLTGEPTEFVIKCFPYPPTQRLQQVAKR